MSGKPVRFACLGPQLGGGSFACVLAALLLPGVSHGVVKAEAGESLDLSQIPFEQLLNLEVYSASKFVQNVSDAPAAVSVITAADIKSFGWRSLADILRSIRGLYVSNDRNYEYLGARGFLRPGDYNTRFLLLVDGYRTNDAVYDQASVGSDFVLDVDTIERVEFVPGPGSSIYGANAFFGVINVISKRGRDQIGPQVSVEAGSFGAHKARVSYGWQGEHGAELLLSAVGYRVAGQDLFFPEFNTPDNNNGIAQGADYDRGHNLFMKAAFGPFGLTVVKSERNKGIPTASFSQVFDDARSHTVDAQTLTDFGYRDSVADRLELNAHVYSGRSEYQGDYIYEKGSPVVNRDGSHARWWGTEFKLVSARFDHHKLVAGFEYQRDYRRDQYNFDVDTSGADSTNPILPVSNLDDRRHGSRAGVYLQDEISLRDNLLLNVGLRDDRDATTGNTLNPRLAAIYKATAATTLKALYGTAFRSPNAYELYYAISSAGGQKPNPDLRSERIRSQELVVEHVFGPDARLTATVFHNSVKDLITQTTDPSDGLLMFKNLNRAVARGVEVEYERVWNSGARLRSSYSLQRTTDAATGAILVNSPRQLAKLNLSSPLFHDLWRAAFETQYVDQRATLRGQTGGHWVANTTLLTTRLVKNMELSASIYNLLDRRYADPGAEEHVQDSIQQDGRSFRMKITYNF